MIQWRHLQYRLGALKMDSKEANTFHLAMELGEHLPEHNNWLGMGEEVNHETKGR